MNPKSIRAWEVEEIYSHFNIPEPYLKTIDIEREFKLVAESTIVFDCQFEVELKLWRDNEGFPSVQCVSAVDAYCGSRKVTNHATINALNAIAEAWAKENELELAEQIKD